MDVLFSGGVVGGGSGGSGGGGNPSGGQSAAVAAAAASVVTAAAATARPPLIASAASGALSGSGAIYSSSSSATATAAAAATTEASFATEAANYLVNPAHFNGHDNGPILYTDPNRTSAIDDIRSVVIYIFIATIFSSFLLILPGIRNEKLPTFFCITTSLLVGSIIVLSLFGTTWHVGEAPISAAYKAFSRDRIQGDLKVRMGLQSVNISLKAHKYYILHHADGPMIMENMPAMNMLDTMASSVSPQQQQQQAAVAPSNPSSYSSQFVEYATSDQATSAAAASFIAPSSGAPKSGVNQATGAGSLADELSRGRTADGIPVDTELETEEVFSDREDGETPTASETRAGRQRNKRQQQETTSKRQQFENATQAHSSESSGAHLEPKYTIKRVHVDINYNERFYWIGPVQMRHEYHQALERGLPYPILTVVEYLSQDDAGFNWSRRYRAAGYYTSMCLWLSASLCILMFCLHCAAPKYGLYAMQLLGLLLMCTNLTYAMLVPRGDQKLVIPFEGQSLTFRFGWNFWLNLAGGCLSLLVGTIIVILDKLFPNFIFTTVLDANFDSQQSYYQRKHKTILHGDRATPQSDDDDENDGASSAASPSPSARHEKPKLPPFMKRKPRSTTTSRDSKRTEGSMNDNKLNQKLKQESTTTKTTIEGERKQEGSGELVEGSDFAKTRSANGKPTSENYKQSGGETLRRRSEHQHQHQQVAGDGASRTNQVLASRNSQAIDHRDIDSREDKVGVERELTIRL